MKAETIVNLSDQKVNLIIDLTAGELGSRISAEEAVNVCRYLQECANEAIKIALLAWLLQHECHDDIVIRDGKNYRFKCVSNKEILTRFGVINVPRRLYQQDNGGETYVPLDEAWGMIDQFATNDVRETLLYTSAYLSPGEIVPILQKVSSFTCSRTAIQNVINEFGEQLNESENDVLKTVRDNEEHPVEDTRSFVASIDGANVRLNVGGAKKGRPTERPKGDESMSRETASCYKNAMVGVISEYGETPVKQASDDCTPERLNAVYVAQMPEENAVDFKQKFEAEVVAALEKLPSDIPNIILNDGGRNLWSYIDSTTLFDDFEKLIDFHHVREHISTTAEGIFGKDSQDGRDWYHKMEGLLLSYDDGAARVIRSIEYYLDKEKRDSNRQKLIQSGLTFMNNNAHRMEYKRFRDNGWAIGSGPVEAACKSIVKLRMCRNGMRWSVTGGQVILTMRSIVKSNRWEQFWKTINNFTQTI
jgi:hypothetical protein